MQIFNKIYYNLTFLQHFSTSASFFEEIEPMFVIHNISIATDDDIIQFGDDVDIPFIFIKGNYHLDKLS